MKRLLSTILLGAMLASCMASCGSETPEVKDTDAAGTDTTVSDVDMSEALELPENLRFNGKTVNILTAEGILATPEELTDEVDLIGKAIYEMDLVVEDRLGVTIDYVSVLPWQDTSGMARQSVNSGSDDYQMVFTCAQHQRNLVDEGLYIPIDDLPYIDIEKPWWNKEYIESVSLHEDDLYILFGDITYNTLQRTPCVFFNIKLLEEKLNMQPSDLYQLVYDGTWTIDKFTELVAGVYEDDGNTVKDNNDIFGMLAPWNEQFNWAAYGSGIKFTGRDENGYPEINLNTPTTVSLVEKLCKLFFESEGVWIGGDHVNMFGNGQVLFYINRFFLAGWDQFRNMQDDFGIIPLPKYDESVDGYHAPVEELVQWGAVPVTVVEREMVSAVAEMLAYEGRQKLTPAYYDTTLKLKFTRDEASMDMIDIIMSGRITDYLYANPLNGLGEVFEKVFAAQQNNFASEYAKVELAGKTALEELIKTYEGRE